MATPNFSEEEIQFRRRARRRLVGAVVLVVVVVAVVPMLLPEDQPKEATQQIEIRIPSQDVSGYAPKIQPVPAPADVQPLAPAAADSAPSSAASAAPAPKPTEAKPWGPTGPEPKPATAAPGPPEAQPGPSASVEKAATQSYFVQYGAFSDKKNAQQKQAEVKAKGIATFTESVKTSAGDKIRVRSGPYGTREEAERVRSQAAPLESKLVVVGK